MCKIGFEGCFDQDSRGGVEVGDLVLEETENPLGDEGCTIVSDEAIPFILLFACSIIFNILDGAVA